MKDTHNIIHILVSSKCLIHFYRSLSVTSISQLYVFIFFWSSKFSQLYHREDPSNRCKVSLCVFNFSFFSLSFCYRSSSWRFYMMVHQGFNFPSRSVHQHSFLRTSSILLRAVRSAILSTIFLEVVLCHFW